MRITVAAGTRTDLLAVSGVVAALRGADHEVRVIDRVSKTLGVNHFMNGSQWPSGIYSPKMTSARLRYSSISSPWGLIRKLLLKKSRS